jgi:hypothetical protein
MSEGLTSSTDVAAATAALTSRERNARYAVEDTEEAARAVLQRAVVASKRGVIKLEMSRVLGMARPPSASVGGRPYSADDGVGVSSPPVPSPPRGSPSSETQKRPAHPSASAAGAPGDIGAIQRELRFGELLNRDAQDASVRASLSAQQRTANAGVVGRLRSLRQTRSS